MAKPEYWFYHITRGTLEGVLPALLEKTLEREWTAKLICDDKGRAEALDEFLWTYRDDSFLPHSREDMPGADQAPIRIAVNGQGSAPAHLHFSIGGAEPDIGDLTQRCIIMIEDSDPIGRDKARSIWARLKEQGVEVTYYQQDDGGKWVKR